MGRSFLFVLAAVVSLFAVSMECTAKNENAGTSGAQILKIGVGAKAVGMGESYVAAADDVYATYWNPAGLINVQTSQVGFMHNEWFEDIRYEFLGYAQPIGSFGALAGMVSYISMGDLERTDEGGNKLIVDGSDKFNPHDILLGLSFGTRLNKSISLGFNAKFLRESIDDKNAQALVVDLGGLYSVSNTNLILGANVQHIGTRMKFVKESFSLPLNVKIGAAYRLMDNALTFVTDFNRSVDSDLNMGLGLEYRVMSVINLRAGYRYNAGGNDLGTLSGLRAGIGVNIRDYSFDYAFVPYGELGQAHRFSLVANF